MTHTPRNSNMDPIKTNLTHKTHLQDLKLICSLTRNAIQPTLGPYGTSALVNNPQNPNAVSTTRDGFTTFSGLGVLRPSGPRHIKTYFNEVVSSMVHRVGDGTSTAILTTVAMIENLLPLIKLPNGEICGVRANIVANLMRRINDHLQEELPKYADTTKIRNGILNVIRTSSNNDPDIIKNLTDAWASTNFQRTPDIIIGNDPRTGPDVVTHQVGMVIDAIPVNRYMFNTASVGGMRSGEYEEAITYISLREFGNDSDIEYIKDALEKQMNTTNQPILIISTEYTKTFVEWASRILANNRQQLNINSKTVPMNFIVLQMNSRTQEETQEFYDAAALAGCKVLVDNYSAFGPDENTLVSVRLSLDSAGMVKTLRVRDSDTTITAFNPDSIQIKNRIQKLQRELETLEEPNLDIRRLQETRLHTRIAALTTGIIGIQPGGLTFGDQSHRVALYEDAMLAARAALQGTLPGGSITSARILGNTDTFDALVMDTCNGTENQFAALVYFIIYISITQPYRTIVDNRVAFDVCNVGHVPCSNEYYHDLENHISCAVYDIPYPKRTLNWYHCESSDTSTLPKQQNWVNRKLSEDETYRYKDIFCIYAKSLCMIPYCDVLINSKWQALYDVVKNTIIEDPSNIDIRVPMATECEVMRLALNVAGRLLTSHTVVTGMLDVDY
jgi:hypothetical protein